MHALALFDFDGTLTFRDSLLDFLFYAVGLHRMVAGAAYLSPALLAYCFRILDHSDAKQKVLQYFFSGWETEKMQRLSHNYSLGRLPKIIRSAGLKRMHWHMKQGHEVLIVSATPEIWIRAWAEEQSVGLMGTLLEEAEGRITGKYQGVNCNGVEKVRRIREKHNLQGFDKIYAYGNSSGDRPMLALAHEKFYKPFQGKS